MRVKYGATKKIALAHIRLAPHHRDRKVPKNELDKLVESIEDFGMINPITVTPRGRAGRIHVLVAGLRRLLAARELRLDEVRCQVIRCDDEHAEAIALTENLFAWRPSVAGGEERAQRLAELRRAYEDRRRRIRVQQRQRRERERARASGVPVPLAHSIASELDDSSPENKECGDIAPPGELLHRTSLEDDLVSVARVSWQRGKISDEQARELAALGRREQVSELTRFLMVAEQERARARAELESADEWEIHPAAAAARLVLDCERGAAAVASQLERLRTVLFEKRVAVADVLKQLDRKRALATREADIPVLEDAVELLAVLAADLIQLGLLRV